MRHVSTLLTVCTCTRIRPSLRYSRTIRCDYDTMATMVAIIQQARVLFYSQSIRHDDPILEQKQSPYQYSSTPLSDPLTTYVPIRVCVFPDPVWPYASAQALKPLRTVSRAGTRLMKMSCWPDPGPKTRSNAHFTALAGCSAFRTETHVPSSSTSTTFVGSDGGGK